MASMGGVAMSELATVRVYWTPIEANLAKSRLESEGIRAVLANEEIAAMNWSMANAIGGIKLQVLPQDLDRAQSLLAEVELHQTADVDEDGWRQESEDLDETGDGDDNDEPALNEREELAKRALKGALFGIIFFPLQFWVTWQVWKVFYSDLPLNSECRRAAWWAFAINFMFLMLFLIWIRAEVNDWTPYEPDAGFGW
jgi:hypothetical protein